MFAYICLWEFFFNHLPRSQGAFVFTKVFCKWLTKISKYAVPNSLWVN
jgi:hypothetical protein